VVPQLGYAPDTGVLAGVKFADRDLFGNGTIVDVDGFYSFEEKRSLVLTLAAPPLWDDRVLILLRGGYVLDPQRRFFGLGNNDQGPTPASTNQIEDIRLGLTLGWRPLERLSFNLEGGFRRANISDGKRLDDFPFTPVAFPELPGVDGGTVNPVALSMVWNSRDDIFRPTRGWRLIVKALHANRAFGSDFEFTQFIVDAGYIRSFFDDRVTFAARINGEVIIGPSGDIPFWELTELGGDDTLRGYFPHRFLGTARALVNTEVRFPILEFDFFELWRVRTDGVLFADTGRVFVSDDELNEDDTVGKLISGFRVDGGFGLRISLSEALVTRIDVGFSSEETGLLYLGFGQTF
jgi:outer membrane protein assembly factor BamA